MTMTVPTGTYLDAYVPMRPRFSVGWNDVRKQFISNFGMSPQYIEKYEKIDKNALIDGYEMMSMSRDFENACSQAYMQGHIRGFMHLDNGHETIPAFVSDSIRKGDIKYSYYREHTHALASGVSPDNSLVEISEIKSHLFMLGVQFHPEFRSRPNRPHPLFVEFIRNASTVYPEGKQPPLLKEI